MKNKSKLLIATIAIIAAVVGICAFQGVAASAGGHEAGGYQHTSGSASHNAPVTVKGDYVIKYEWPEKPKVGNYTLKVNLADKDGAPVQNAEVKVSYDMPAMRGHHATTDIMKRNNKGDYLLPIHFAMRGGWEIIISAERDKEIIATKTIFLDI